MSSTLDSIFRNRLEELLSCTVVCCVSDQRPHWLPFLWQQFRNMDGRGLVLVSACDNFETHVAFFESLLREDSENLEVFYCFPEGMIQRPSSGNVKIRVLLDFTMPPIRSQTTTIGAKRNRALELAQKYMKPEWITWLDDDDLVHRDRLLIPVAALLQAQGQIDFVLMNESCPLLHLELLRAQPEGRRSYNWASGLFRSTAHPEFPPLNLSEDYFMMQHVLSSRKLYPERVCQALSATPLTVHLAHGENASVADLSENLDYWPIEPQQFWLSGGGGWTGLGLAPKRSSQSAP